MNSFQVVLIDRSDVQVGDFDIEFNYNQVLWETGDAGGGSGGLGGSSARVGVSNGSSSGLEFFGSGISKALLDGNFSSGLIHGSLNSTTPGRYVIEVRNGAVAGSLVANAGSDQTVSNPAVLSGSVTGSGGLPLTYQWTQTSGPFRCSGSNRQSNPTQHCGELSKSRRVQRSLFP